MSATRMMILGLVQWMQPVHGYDVRRELLSWSADKWANIQPGSIYHALRKLADEELLREVATEQVGSRPARTTYEITEKGAEEFTALLRGNWWSIATPPDPFMAAFSFLLSHAARGGRRGAAEPGGAAGRRERAAPGRDRRRLGALQADLRDVDVGALHGALGGGDPLVRADRGAHRVGRVVSACRGEGPGAIGMARPLINQV
nr:hypothetical protein GCM10020092_011200 [Actinoplanes digitatis]